MGGWVSGVVGVAGANSDKYLRAAAILDLLRPLSKNLVFTFECTRMKFADRQALSAAFQTEPVEIDNRGFAPLSRPRWWWLGGKPPKWPPGTRRSSVNNVKPGEHIAEIRPRQKPVSWKDCLLPGYIPCAVHMGKDVLFRCLTPKLARSQPGPNAIGLSKGSDEARLEWADHMFCQAPSQFEKSNMVEDRNGRKRRLLPWVISLFHLNICFCKTQNSFCICFRPL